MLEILLVTVPIYACVFVGFVATRWGPFRREDMDVLGSFVINIAMPALLFLSVVGRPVSDIANPTYLAAYALTSVAAVLLGYVYSRRAEGTGRSGAAFDALQVGGANSGFVGYPVLLTVMPALAGVVLGMNVLVESVLTLPLVFFLAERGAADASTLRRQVAGTLLRMIQMPVFAALLAGMALSLAGVRVPEVGVTTLDLLGRAATGWLCSSSAGCSWGSRPRVHLLGRVRGPLGRTPGTAGAAAGHHGVVVRHPDRAAGRPAVNAGRRRPLCTVVVR